MPCGVCHNVNGRTYRQQISECLLSGVTWAIVYKWSRISSEVWTVLRFEIGHGDREALERWEQYWMFEIECDLEALERCELYWNTVITKLWRGANSIGCSRFNVALVWLMYFTYSSTADQMKLQESSWRTQCVIVVRSSLALVWDVPCWAYIQAHAAIVGNTAMSTGWEAGEITRGFWGTDEWEWAEYSMGYATVWYRLQHVLARSTEKWCNIETRENDGNYW